MGIPEMRKRGYSDQIATGTIAAGGTLGVLIPPSIVLIVYGIATGTSIGRLFLCGLVPEPGRIEIIYQLMYLLLFHKQLKQYLEVSILLKFRQLR